MKEGWEYKRLLDVCEAYQPKTIPSKDLVKNGKYLVYGANGIIGRYNEYNHECSEILLTCRGATCGSINVSMPFSWINGNAMVIHPTNNDIDKEFLVYALKTLDYSTIITGAAQPQITRKSLSDVNIPIPPLHEQRSIVSRLDAAFAKIDTIKANAERMLSDARALFQAELDNALSPQEGWEEKKLKEICYIKSTLVNPQEYEYQNLPHVGGANIIPYTGCIINLKTAKEEKLNSSKFLFYNTDVLYNKIRPYLIKVAKPCFTGLCSADMYPLTPATTVARDFLFYLLISKDFTSYAVAGSARAGMPKVNRKYLFDYSCFIPDIHTQRSIASRLDALSAKLRAIEQTTARTVLECAAMKQAMLRQAFG